MYRSYCNERGCPGHVKNWESCRERRAFAGATIPGARLGEEREPFARRIAFIRTFQDAAAPHGKLK